VKTAVLAALLSLTVSGPGHAEEVKACTNGIFVVGALHGLHAKSNAFGYTRLRQLLDDLAPEVLLAEVTPEELQSIGETKGRPEYPEVIWPYLREHRSDAVALEPAGKQYKRLVDASSSILTEVKREHPAQAGYWASYQKSMEMALLAYWTTPARTQDVVTSDLARSWYAMQQATLGPAYARVQSEWDRGMVGRMKSAIKQFPSSRIVVLVSHRNRHLFEEAIRNTAPVRAQDVSRWLASEAPICRPSAPQEE
jgi:hypothetical protein